MKDQPQCCVCLKEVPTGQTYYTTGYKCGRDPKRSDERLYCGEECRAFGRTKLNVTMEELHDIWQQEQNRIAASDHFLHTLRSTR